MTGEVVTASNLNADTSTLGNFILAPPLCIVYATITQTLTNSSFAALNFDSEIIDSDSGHNNTNPSRYTSQTPGWYLPGGAWAINAATGGRRLCQWRTNGSTIQQSSQTIFAGGSLNDTSGFASTRMIFLNANDYVELLAFQDSGANQSTDVSQSQGQPWMQMMWVHS